MNYKLTVSHPLCENEIIYHFVGREWMTLEHLYVMLSEYIPSGFSFKVEPCRRGYHHSLTEIAMQLQYIHIEKVGYYENEWMPVTKFWGSEEPFDLSYSEGYNNTFLHSNRGYRGYLLSYKQITELFENNSVVICLSARIGIPYLHGKYTWKHESNYTFLCKKVNIYRTKLIVKDSK